MAQIETKNPLLNYQEFVDYDLVKANHIVPAVKQVIKEAKIKLEEILKTGVNPQLLTFQNTLYAFIELEEMITRAWTPVENLLSLVGDQGLRKAADEARPLVVDFLNDYSLDLRVYELIKSYAKTDEAKNLSGEEKRHLENTLKEFKLSGAELEEKYKKEFKKLNLGLSELSQKFSDNVTDSKFELILVDEEDLSGLPEDFIIAAKTKATEYRQNLGETKVPQGAALINLDYPSYGPFMKFADSSCLRKLLYLEYLSKGTKNASKGLLDEKKYDLNNEPLIQKIFRAKTRKAHLLGYKNYAEVSLETKMAPNPQEVKIFLERLAMKVKSLAQKEYQELLEFQQKIGYVNSENNPETVYPWDKEYLSEKLKKSKFDFDTNLTKQYFELGSTINGVFTIANKIFNIEFKKNTEIKTWHKDVEVYEVTEKNGKKLGIFYMDLFPRDTKRQGAWVMPLVEGHLKPNGKRVLPQCTLSCNLTKPTDNQPSLLTHTEVVTLFHEFGHAFHHLLSEVKLEPLAGTNVDWDFVELPSQLNENFCWEKVSLELFAKHYQTSKPIPDELLSNMLASRNFNEGLGCIRQLEFALFDLAIYMRWDLEDKTSANDIFKKIVRDYGFFQVWEGTNFPCSFSHIFGGGYAAGYYSYKWAEILEADAFSRFKADGVLSTKVGEEYRRTILEKGDSKPPMELFKDFMGREPSENALLERMGLNV